MQKKIFCTMFLLAFFSGLILTPTAEMSGHEYRISTSVISGGGMCGRSSRFQAEATTGQSSPLMNNEP
jgi:hypothetical protein